MRRSKRGVGIKVRRPRVAVSREPLTGHLARQPAVCRQLADALDMVQLLAPNSQPEHPWVETGHPWGETKHFWIEVADLGLRYSTASALELAIPRRFVEPLIGESTSLLL